MKDKQTAPSGVQDLCRKLKDQLEELSAELKRDTSAADEEKRRLTQLMTKLQEQIADLSS